MLRAHLSKSLLLLAQAEAALKSGSVRDKHLNSGQLVWRSEQMHLMFDNLPYYVSFMEDAGFDDRDVVEAAWIALVFRGFCWGVCHAADELGEMLPAKYYGSRMPVYLT